MNTKFQEKLLKIKNRQIECLTNNAPISEELQKQIEAVKVYENYERHSIFEYLKACSTIKYGSYSEEKEKLVFDTVEELYRTDLSLEKATQPGLLLGKIQSGKTDTFVSIIGRAFDAKGVNIAIVMTKGVSALAKQTLSRLRDDFEKQIDGGRVLALDVMDKQIKNIEYEVDHMKLIIVCKKEDDNLQRLLDLFENNKYMQNRQVLMVDDEADFSSRNYKISKGTISMLENSKKIEHLNKLLNKEKPFMRYLQVTATPYSLYLQPDGTIKTKEFLEVSSFRPRFTKLVPVHSSYIGGDEYFEQSKDPESMCSELFYPLKADDDGEIPLLTKMENRNSYLLRKNKNRKSYESKALEDLSFAIIDYFISTAVRRVQEKGLRLIGREDSSLDYKSSALFHLDVGTKSHEWQHDIIKQLIEDICSEYRENPTAIHSTLDELSNKSLKKLHRQYNKGIVDSKIGLDVPFPEEEDIMREFQNIIMTHNYEVYMVNSSNEGKPILDEENQLKLNKAANIFIGGNILDRGITINNMILFFYGRDPQKMQMDTVLQHARMYGGRSKRDMAVTTFITSRAIHSILTEMHEVDEELRKWIMAGNDIHDPAAIFIGTGKGFKLCASQKIKVANTMAMKSHKMILPYGMQTLSCSQMKPLIEDLDKELLNAGCSDRGFVEVDREWAYDLIDKIRDTYAYGKKHENSDLAWDTMDMKGAIQYATDKTDGKLLCYVRTNASLERVKLDGGFSDAPMDSKEEMPNVRKHAEHLPVLMLIRENGCQDKGWMGAPFYWPVFVVQKDIKPAVFTINGEIKHHKKSTCDFKKILTGIKEDEYLLLNLQSKYGDAIRMGGKMNEYRELTSHDKSKYIVINKNTGEPLLTPSVETVSAGVYSYNDGIFPFVLKEYKYILFKMGQTGSAYMLVKLVDSIPEVSPSHICEDDSYTNRSGEEIYAEDDTQAIWKLTYKLGRVLRILQVVDGKEVLTEYPPLDMTIKTKFDGEKITLVLALPDEFYQLVVEKELGAFSRHILPEYENVMLSIDMSEGHKRIMPIEYDMLEIHKNDITSSEYSIVNLAFAELDGDGVLYTLFYE